MSGLFKCWACQSFGFDLRSLALLRVVVCYTYLLELLLHWQYIEAFYTDAGMLPGYSIFDGTGRGWSTYLAVSGLVGARVLYICHLAAVVCLLVGWRTRWVSLVCYIWKA